MINPSDLNRFADDPELWLKEKVITAVSTLLHIFRLRGTQQVDTSVDYHPNTVPMPTKLLPINPGSTITQQLDEMSIKSQSREERVEIGGVEIRGMERREKRKGKTKREREMY